MCRVSCLTERSVISVLFYGSIPPKYQTSRRPARLKEQRKLSLSRILGDIDEKERPFIRESSASVLQRAGSSHNAKQK